MTCSAISAWRNAPHREEAALIRREIEFGAEKQHWPIVCSAFSVNHMKLLFLRERVYWIRDDCVLTGPKSFDGAMVKSGNVLKQWRILIYSRGLKCAFFEGAPTSIFDFLIISRHS